MLPNATPHEESPRRPGLMRTAKNAVIAIAFKWLEDRGYDMSFKLEPYQRESKAAFFAAEQAARRRYDALDEKTKLELPFKLNAKYETTPVLGSVRVYDAIAELATIIDPLDPYLGCVSQLTHQLQLAMAMEQDGLDEQFILCGLVHDLGKLLIKFGDEDPINVEAAGKKIPLHGNKGEGLFKCTFRWDHGDFAYMRLRDYASPEVSWLVRHHSIDIPACEPYMDDRDREYVQRLLLPFVYYDNLKDLYALPRKQLEDYRPLIERAFPDEILI
jgi:hypothetical protein